MTAPTAEALKPCPFCGGAAELNDYTDRPVRAWVVTHRAKGCVVAPLIENFPSRASAIAAWNRRALSAVPDDGLGSSATPIPGQLEVAVWEFLSDWRKGDFDLVGLAALDAVAVEKAWERRTGVFPEQAAPSPSVPTEQADRAVVASRATVKTGDEVWVRGEASDVCTSCVFVRVPTIHDKPMGSYLHWRNVRVAAVSPGEQPGIGAADEPKDIPADETETRRRAKMAEMRSLMHPAKSDSSTGGA